MRVVFLLFVLACLPAMTPPSAHADVAASDAAQADAAQAGIALAGDSGSYRVRKGDNLTVIAARLGVSVAQLKAANPGLDYNRLRPGQPLAYRNHHIVPPAPVAMGHAVLINVPQRMLFHYRDGQWLAAYPVAAGRGLRQWQTPLGDTRIETCLKDKPWIVPPSIQEEMRASGQPVLTRVEPGPDNPLGRYWLGLALPGIGIHGTNAPASVYSHRTHGCLRLQPEHIETLFADMAPGVPVRIIYAPVLLYVPSDGPIWLEAHPDVYARGLDYPALFRRLADEAGVTDRIDAAAAESLLEKRDGLAGELTVAPPRSD